MHFISLWNLCFGKAQYFSFCGKFYEIDSNAKVGFLWFGFPAIPEKWRFLFFSFLNYYINIHRLFIFTCDIIITSKTSLLDVVGVGGGGGGLLNVKTSRCFFFFLGFSFADTDDTQYSRETLEIRNFISLIDIILDPYYNNLPKTGGEFELASTLILYIQTKQLTT